MKNISQCFFYVVLCFLLLPACKSTTIVGEESMKAATAEQVALLISNLASNSSTELGKDLIYYLDEPLTILNLENFTLDGNGSTIIQRKSDADVILVEGGNNIVLKNFKATHTEPSGPIGCTGSVIQVYNSSNLLIENCQLNGSGIIGVVAYNAANLNVSNCYIYNNSQYGILFDDKTDIVVASNRFEDNGDTGSAHVGRALDAFLREVEMISADENKEGLQMSGNRYE